MPLLLLGGCRHDAIQDNGLTNDQPLPALAKSYVLDTAALHRGLVPGLQQTFMEADETYPLLLTMMLNPKHPPRDPGRALERAASLMALDYLRAHYPGLRPTEMATRATEMGEELFESLRLLTRIILPSVRGCDLYACA